MSAAAGQAELHTFSLIKNLHRLVRSARDKHSSSCTRNDNLAHRHRPSNSLFAANPTRRAGLRPL